MNVKSLKDFKNKEGIKMGFKKIEDFNLKNTCRDPEHYPPTQIVLEPGIYEWTCPNCGNVTIVNIPKITCQLKRRM